MKIRKFSTIIAIALLLLFSGCDMEYITRDTLPEIPEPPQPPALVIPERHLKLYNLPLGTRGHHVTATFVSDHFGQIARLDPGFEEIPVYHDFRAERSIIFVPLVGPLGEDFTRIGNFAIELRVFIDWDISIVITLEQQVLVPFLEGRGQINLDLRTLIIYYPERLQGIIKGFFNGGLTNPDDTASPVLRAGTVFEMNGRYFRITDNTPVSMGVGADIRTQILYLYAEQVSAGVAFELSHVPPFRDPIRRGWYLGLRRALFKLVFIRDTPNQFAAKTFIDDDFILFDSYVINVPSRSNIPEFYFALSAGGNPPPQIITLEAGVYIFELSGAGGGSGGNSNTTSNRPAEASGAPGGAGGFIAELVILTEDTTLTVFAGQGGVPGERGRQPDNATTINRGRICGRPVGNFYNWWPANHCQCNVNTAMQLVELTTSGGVGGGGSGTFIFSQKGYLLVAGGGGGGGGFQGAAGGAGGSVGSGGGGGSTVNLSSTATHHVWRQRRYIDTHDGGNRALPVPVTPFITLVFEDPPVFINTHRTLTIWEITRTYSITFTAPRSIGGAGGGFGGGNPGMANNDNGRPGSFFGPANFFGYAGTTGSFGGGGTAAFSFHEGLYQRWKNTNGANGRGGGGGSPGQAGGNNRNNIRGGGSIAGTDGHAGGDGFIAIRRVH